MYDIFSKYIRSRSNSIEESYEKMVKYKKYLYNEIIKSIGNNVLEEQLQAMYSSYRSVESAIRRLEKDYPDKFGCERKLKRKKSIYKILNS